MSVGLVIVSHSVKIAAGVVELASQMAGSTRIIAAGGTDDGAIGTSFEKVSDAIGRADDGGGVVVLCDLGSAILTTETALDFLADDIGSRVRIADAPIVEGAVAAAVAAETGGDLAIVLAAAESAGVSAGAAGGAAGASESAGTAESAADAGAVEVEPGSAVVGSGPAPIRAGTPEVGIAAASGSATLVNSEGLHARPAAEFVKLASRFDAVVTVNGVDAKSLLRIMSLGLTAGSEVSVSADGPDAAAAVDALVALVASGFGQ